MTGTVELTGRRRDRARRAAYAYTPTPKQELAHAAYADELLFGGAAGPGKSEWLIAECVAACAQVPGFAAVIFRRTFPELAQPGGLILRLLERIPRGLATYNASEHTWRFRNGSILRLSHMQYEKDALAHQGAEYQLAAFDELTGFTEWQYRYIGSRLRASGDLARRLAALRWRPRRIAATNPGGPGHGWVKARFIDPAPPTRVWRPAPTLDEPNPGTRVFIPARLEDNPHLDASYRQRLESLPSDERRALLTGDWDVYAGQRFTDWRRDVHVIRPEDYPLPLGGVTRAVGVDYGLDAPYAALWGALGPDRLLVVYREDYGPGYTPREQARRILSLEQPGERTPQRPVPVYADPSTWARQPSSPKPTSPSAPPRGSIAADYAAEGLPVTRANNDRLRGAGLVADLLRVRKDGRPRLLVYDTCINLIRTLPALPRDPRRPEDVDTRAEDHAYDALRYLAAGLEGLDHARPADQAGRAGHVVTDPDSAARLRRQGF